MKLHRFEYQSTVDGIADWYLFHDAGKEKDCIVLLHGHGSHGDQILTRSDLAPWRAYLAELDVSVLSPNLRDNAWMSPAAAADLHHLLAAGKETHAWRRIFFAAGSMGGTSALIFAMLHPELADGLVILGAATDIGRYASWCAAQPEIPVLREIHSAISAAYTPTDFALHNVCAHARNLTMPIHFHHGNADAIIPVSEARHLAEIFHNAGRTNFHYHEIEGGNHDSPLPFFRAGLEKLFSTGAPLRRRNWREILKLERTTAQPEDPFAPPRRYNLCSYEQGRYYELHPDSTEPECIQHAKALAWALERLPLHFHPEQEFFGGAETFRADELPPEITQEQYDRALKAFRSHGVRHFGVGWSHTIPDYNELIAHGLGSFVRRAEERRHKEPDNPVCEGMWIALRGVAAFFLRAADAFREQRPEAAARLRRIADGKPETFDEALQLMWLIFVVLEAADRSHNALGRIDQYLYESYLRSAPDHETALYLFCHIWVKIEGFHEVTNICIGGVTPDGRDAVNELSFLALEATRLVHSASTNLSARLHRKIPDRFLLGCIDLIRTGIGFPAVFNDEVNIPMLTNLGIPLEAARDYALVGCVETFLPGRQPAWSDGRFNMPEIFTETILRLEEFDSFAALFDAFTAGMRRGLEHYRDEYNRSMAAYPPDKFPDPLLSALTRDCIARGRDVNDGGGEFFRLHGIGMMGLATLTDSLCAVKKLVFDEKRIAPRQLVNALKNDFCDDEELRLTLINCAPKYGNDDDEADSIAAGIVKLCGDLTESLRTADGGYLQSCMASNIQNISAGREVMATPDGRHAGTALSDAASPNAGRDRHGPTAFVNSIVRPDYTAQNCTVVNMRFQPEMFEKEAGAERMLRLLRCFIENGGQEMQFNVTSNATLKAAMAEPEKYADLIVRVSGFSAFFTRLSREVQMDILRRNAHAL